MSQAAVTPERPPSLPSHVLDALEIDPSSAETRAAFEATRTAKATLDAAELAIREAKGAIAHEQEMTELAASQRAEAARAEKEAQLDQLVATLGRPALEGELRPLLSELVAAYDQVAKLLPRVDQVLAARQARRSEAQAIARSLGYVASPGQPLWHELFSDQDRPVSMARDFFAKVLGQHCTAHSLPRHVATWLSVAAAPAVALEGA